MSDGEFIILDVRADVGSVLASRGSVDRSVVGSTLSTHEILVARPRGMSVSDYVSITTTKNRKAALDASGDPAKIVARSMPISLIRPVSDAGGARGDADPVASAKVAGASWGITDVLGPRPKDINGGGVKVAVLDTGIAAEHAAFAPLRDAILKTRRNFTTGKDADLDGHGTHCAGTILGRDVDGVRIGVAPGISDVLIGKVIDDRGFGTTKSVLDALKWAHSEGANVISMSLGFDFPKMQKNLMKQGHPAQLATSIALKAYRDNLRQFEALANLLMQENDESAGAVIVAAAGNESRREQHPDFFIRVGPPRGGARDLISVGAPRRAQDRSLEIAAFSNVNPRLSAPGVDIISASSRGGLRADSGTSMACPHVAGVAALWWSWIRHRNQGHVRASDVAAQLTATARDDVFAAGVTFADRGAGAGLALQR